MSRKKDGFEINLPNLLTASRFIFGVIMVYFAYHSALSGFLVFYVAALVSDILDGASARKTKTTTQFGKRFDVMADNFMLVCVILGVYLLKPALITKFTDLFAFVFVYYLLVQILSKVMFKEFIFMRTYAANLAAIVFPVMIFIWLAFDMAILIYVYIVLMIFSLTEKFMMKMKKIDKPTLIGDKRLTIILIVVVILLVLAMVWARHNLAVKGPHACYPDGYCMSLEIRDTTDERAIGLMYRNSIAEDEGMIFVFDQPARYSFWMKNMLMNIDMIFLDSDKNIIYMAKDVPPCEEEPCALYTPDTGALYVIETKAGFSDRHHLTFGQQVDFTLE